MKKTNILELEGAEGVRKSQRILKRVCARLRRLSTGDENDIEMRLQAWVSRPRVRTTDEGAQQS